jgi:hypothetical protein
MIAAMVRIAFAVLLVLLIDGASIVAQAQIYRWTDDQGRIHYTDGVLGIPERYRSSAAPIGLSNAPPAPPTRDAPAGSPVTGATIRFTPGERIMVDAKLNGSTTVRLLLDTGADRTLISPKALGAAGVTMSGAPTGSIAGVTGQADAQAVAVDLLEIQQARVTKMQVIAFEMNRPGVDGLLGRDFLDHFHVTIDSAAGTVAIRPR